MIGTPVQPRRMLCCFSLFIYLPIIYKPRLEVISTFGNLEQPNLLIKYSDLNANYIVLQHFSHHFCGLIAGSSAKILHTAAFFIVCHQLVCNLSPVLSNWCNMDIMQGLSSIMCQCYGFIVGDASLTHWLEPHLASVCLITFWHSRLIFLALPLSSPLSSSLSFCVVLSATAPPLPPTITTTTSAPSHLSVSVGCIQHCVHLMWSW